LEALNFVIQAKGLSSTVFKDAVTSQNSKREGGHGEKVHGRNSLVIIAQKSVYFMMVRDSSFEEQFADAAWQVQSWD